MGRIALQAPARAALLLLAAWASISCEHGGTGPNPASGVVWERITPVEAPGADRPDWRADSIAFQVSLQGTDLIAVSLEDGSGLAIFPFAGGTGARSPRWVRSGLLLESSDVAGTEDLWYRETATGTTRRLESFPGLEWSPAPRPGAPGLVYVEGSNSESGRLVLIPDTAAVPLGRIFLTPPTLLAGEADWNPAGDAICFSAEGPGGSRQIWKLSLADTLPIQLTVAGSANPPTGPILDRSPRWSPDGTRILMASNRGGRWGLWTVDPQGEGVGLDLIARDLGPAEIRHPVWSPDGSEILLSSDRTGDRALWKLSNLGL